MAEEAMQTQSEENEAVEVELEPQEETQETQETQETENVETKEHEDEIEQQSEKVKKRINKLTYKVREAERRENAALEYAKGLQNELNKTKNTLSKTDKNLYDEYKARVDTQLGAARADYKKAYEAGDTEGMLQAQEEVAKYAVEQESLTRVQAQQQEEAQAQQLQQEQYVQQPLPDPALTAQPDPKAQEWASRNEWFGKDLAMTTSAFAFHRQLVESEGYDPTSDEYYSEVDKRLREAFPHKYNEAQSQGSVNEVVTGSSRGATTTRSQSRKKVKLTPSQVAIAKRLGVPLEEYAKHVK
tara:strand:+ start:4467 stop:5366 length:900 start_codon:yes stop_codon:yes gene_type:complete